MLRCGKALYRRRRIGRPLSRKVSGRVASLKPGDPMDKATTLGPLSTETALTQLLSQIERAVANGATLVLGGKRIDRPGFFI